MTLEEGTSLTLSSVIGFRFFSVSEFSKYSNIEGVVESSLANGAVAFSVIV